MSSDTSLIFMGTPAFSIPTLKALVRAGYNVVATFTQPPRPQGRGYTLTPSPVHSFSEAHGIPVFTPESLKAPEDQALFLDLVHKHQVKVAIVVAYGLLLPQAILSAPEWGCLNVHASLLPRWRGAAPIQRAIEAGDSHTGLTLMQMETGLDTGPMLLTREITISDTDTSETLHNTLSALGGELVIAGLNLRASSQLTPHPQPNEGTTHAAKILKEESLLIFDVPAAVLERKVRAFSPWPGTHFMYQGRPIKVLSATVKSTSLSAKPGVVISDNLEIMTGDGTLFCPIRLQRAGGAALDTQEFLRGFPIPSGTKLGIQNASL